jgi:hypothetical protein
LLGRAQLVQTRSITNLRVLAPGILAGTTSILKGRHPQH